MKETQGHSRGAAYDAAVIGLGPVGAAAALLLAREGLHVLAVEPSHAPNDKPRAIGLDHESLRTLQKVVSSDDLAPLLGAYQPSEYRSGAGTLLRRIVPQAAPFPLSWPPYNTFIQPEQERLLRARLVADPLIELALGWRMTALEQDSDVVRIELANEQDEEQAAECRYLVGCDGAWSPVREALGITYEDLSFDEPWLVVDVRVSEGAKLPEAITQYCDPARPATFVRGPRELCRWEIMLLPGENPTEMLTEDRIWALLSRWLTPAEGTIWRAATYRFHALVAKRFGRGRVFIAGDAAHQTPPFMAQGLNQGFRDVGNLCWKRGEVAARGAHPAILDTYDSERRPNARTVIELTKTAGRLICERDPAAAAERGRRMLAEVAAGQGELVRQDLLPPVLPGPLILPDADGTPPLTGTLCPQPTLSTPAGKRRMDDVMPARFLLLSFGDWAPEEHDRASAKQLGVTIAHVGRTAPPGAVTVDDRSGLLAAWQARHRLVAVLVRPDHLVFGVTRGAGGEAGLLGALADALGHAEAVPPDCDPSIAAAAEPAGRL